MVSNLLIHKRLSKVRLILLIMSISPISDDINEDVLLEFLAIGHCNFHALVEDIRLICVYVNDRGIYGFGNFSAVKR